MLGWLRSHSELRSQRGCSTRSAPGTFVTLVKRGDKASYRHLVGCNRLDCPVCGPRVAEREAADIALAVTAHYANGGSVAFVTLTLRHVIGQALGLLLAGLAGAWKSCRESKRPRALWSAVTDGYIRKLEVTWGRNGWHPHLHLLVFVKPGATAADVAELCEAVFTSWAGRLVREGLGEPTRERGVTWELLDLEAAQERVGNYVAKDAGRELASAGTKLGRRRGQQTTFELLAAAATGDHRAGWRFLEYEDAMRGRSRVEWSVGLKDRLLDPELQESADEDQGRDIAVLPQITVDALRANDVTGAGPGLGHLRCWAEARSDDAEAFDLIYRQCRRHGIPPPSVPDRLLEAWTAIRRPEPLPPPRPLPPQLRLV